MPEYEFFLIRIFPHKDKIKDFALEQESTGQKKYMFWHTLHISTDYRFSKHVRKTHANCI